MLYIAFLLCILTTNLSQTANQFQNKYTVRDACDPLASALCCPLLQIAINGSSHVLLPTIPGLGENLDTHTAVRCAAATATCLAPYAARFTTECLLDCLPCKDPLETCCPRVRQGNYLPALGLACKGPLSAGALALDLALLQFCPSLGKTYEFLPDLLGCDKDASILCVGYEMLTAATCLSHYTAGYCSDNAPQLCAYCKQLDCYSNAAEDAKED